MAVFAGPLADDDGHRYGKENEDHGEYDDRGVQVVFQGGDALQN